MSIAEHSPQCFHSIEHNMRDQRADHIFRVKRFWLVFQLFWYIFTSLFIDVNSVTRNKWGFKAHYDLISLYIITVIIKFIIFKIVCQFNAMGNILALTWTHNNRRHRILRLIRIKCGRIIYRFRASDLFFRKLN